MTIQHAALTDPELHEPIGISGANADEIYTADGAGSGAWTAYPVLATTATAAEVNTLDGITATTAELNILDGVTATAVELNDIHLTLDIADGSADTSYYVVSPVDGLVSKIRTVIDDVVSTADITVTSSIGGVSITDGQVTIATAGSAAGDVDSATPSALNSISAGSAVKFAVAGGGAGGAPRIHLVLTITR